jgi:hypothetical protein
LNLSSLTASLTSRLALASRALDTLFTSLLFQKKLYKALGSILSVAVLQAIALTQTSLFVVLKEWCFPLKAIKGFVIYAYIIRKQLKPQLWYLPMNRVIDQ